MIHERSLILDQVRRQWGRDVRHGSAITNASRIRKRLLPPCYETSYWG